MAKGRKPKPTALRVLQGNRGHHKLNAEEPEFLAGAPVQPAWVALDKYAAEEWAFLVEKLVSQRVLTVADKDIMELACSAYSQLMRNEDALRAFGADAYKTTTRDGDDIWRAYPHCAQRNRARDQHQKFLCELGLTPTSRTKVKKISSSKPSGVKRLLG
jgi:P27 family predicted phage terminase small subunit